MFSLKAILMSIQVRITKVRLPDQLNWVRSFKPSASEAHSDTNLVGAMKVGRNLKMY